MFCVNPVRADSTSGTFVILCGELSCPIAKQVPETKSTTDQPVPGSLGQHGVQVQGARARTYSTVFAESKSTQRLRSQGQMVRNALCVRRTDGDHAEMGASNAGR
jgi:hypothetical protein